MEYLRFFNMDFQVELIFTLSIVVPSLIIFFRTNHLYKLSNYNGLKYFRNSFMYFAIAFTIKFFFSFEYNIFTGLAFFYALTVAGFYLVYSLIWKSTKTKEYFLHLVGFVIAIIDTVFTDGFVMFITMLLIMAYAIVISHCNYKKHCSKSSQFFFLGIIIGFTGYLVNFLALYFSVFNNEITSKTITSVTFLLILFGVLSIWQKKGKDLK